jgi:phosphoribosylaminoimidazole (AIR) synthetase
MGIGMTWVVEPEQSELLIHTVGGLGYKAYRIGDIVEGEKRVVLHG